ncbi:hypothetical protein vseg_009569 [Gypsophila vaccaria]
MCYGKRRRKDTDGKDRLSSLPDDIIANILPLLSIKNAAATSVLARPWRAAWSRMTYLNLHIDLSLPHPPSPSSLSFLPRHVLPKLVSKNVSICFRDCSSKFDVAVLEPWFRLFCDWHFQDIHFKCEVNGATITPSSLGILNGISNNLRSLKLDHVMAPLHLSTVFPKLTYLLLNWTSYDSKEVEYFLYASPVLEVLVLKFGQFDGFVTCRSAAEFKLTHLKRVELHISNPICFAKAQHLFKFFKYLVTAAPLLEVIIFKYTSQLSRRGMKEMSFRKEIQAFPKSCPLVKIVYVGKYNKLKGLGPENFTFW